MNLVEHHVFTFFFFTLDCFVAVALHFFVSDKPSGLFGGEVLLRID